VEAPQQSDAELALERGKLWQPGQTIRVRFLDGVPTVKAKVEQVAHQWSLYANIKFAFGSDPGAEIRISFANPGSWSYIGRDCLGIPKLSPTMNYGWLKTNTSNTEYERVVLHEFGHALGCIHEHQNPVVGIPWNKPAVYSYYAATNGWDKGKVDRNLFQTYSVDQTQFSHFDRESIMLYPVPKNLTDGSFEVGWNKQLSAADKAYIQTIYPFTQLPGSEIKVGGAPTNAELLPGGEIHQYRFQIAKAGNYVLETSGRTDVYMTLLGPDDLSVKLAEDDDGGEGLNARIAAGLTPGTYFAQVRHYRKSGRGRYAIAVRLD
jgi:hypothetical protein